MAIMPFNGLLSITSLTSLSTSLRYFSQMGFSGNVESWMGLFFPNGFLQKCGIINGIFQFSWITLVTFPNGFVKKFWIFNGIFQFSWIKLVFPYGFVQKCWIFNGFSSFVELHWLRGKWRDLDIDWACCDWWNKMRFLYLYMWDVELCNGIFFFSSFLILLRPFHVS